MKTQTQKFAWWETAIMYTLYSFIVLAKVFFWTMLVLWLAIVFIPRVLNGHD